MQSILTTQKYLDTIDELTSKRHALEQRVATINSMAKKLEQFYLNIKYLDQTNNVSKSETKLVVKSNDKVKEVFDKIHKLSVAKLEIGTVNQS